MPNFSSAAALSLCLVFSIPAFAGYDYNNSKFGSDNKLTKEFKQMLIDAHEGNGEAQANLGMFYEINGSSTLAEHWLLEAAQTGHNLAVGYYELADHLAYGDYSDETEEQQAHFYKKAAKLYLKDARAGNAEAQLSIAHMYYMGKGIQEDLNKSFYWYEKAAFQGKERAQISLAEMYRDGTGIDRDELLAFSWFYVVASRTDQSSDYYTRKITRYMDKYDDQWLIGAVKLGNTHIKSIKGSTSVPTNPHALISMKYANTDLAKSHKHMLIAAKDGDGRSQMNVARMYYHGHGTKVNKKYAYAWLAVLAAKEDGAIPSRDRIASELDISSLAEAKQLAKEYIEKYSGKN